MLVQQWIMFGSGILLILLGAGLLTWGVVQNKARAGAIKDVATILEKIANLFDAIGRFFGPEPATRAGGFLIVVGAALIVGAFVIPSSRS
jgi:hypothetical protein